MHSARSGEQGEWGKPVKLQACYLVGWHSPYFLSHERISRTASESDGNDGISRLEVLGCALRGINGNMSYS